jgi:hypothetical protein
MIFKVLKLIIILSNFSFSYAQNLVDYNFKINKNKLKIVFLNRGVDTLLIPGFISESLREQPVLGSDFIVDTDDSLLVFTFKYPKTSEYYNSRGDIVIVKNDGIFMPLCLPPNRKVIVKFTLPQPYILKNIEIMTDSGYINLNKSKKIKVGSVRNGVFWYLYEKKYYEKSY